LQVLNVVFHSTITNSECFSFSPTLAPSRRLHRSSARRAADDARSDDATANADDVPAGRQSDAHDATAIPVIESTHRDTADAGNALHSARNYKSNEFSSLTVKTKLLSIERSFRLADDASCPRNFRRK
jgi:hypothetical protein